MARRSKSLAACFGCLLSVTALAPAAAARTRTEPIGELAPEPPAAVFGETLDVPLFTFIVRVVDTWGHPILGLEPEDLRVRIGRREAPILALDWIGAEEEAATPATTDATAVPDDGAAPTSPAQAAEQATRDAAGPPGRLVVLFVQTDLNPSRISGQLRLRPYTEELLATLHPGDRVAVVSFDSHLKLWQDFDTDLAAAHAAVDRAMLYTPDAEVAPAPRESLAHHLDRAAARAAASPERALEVLASALVPLPGEKTLIFLGWGLGRFDTSGVRMTPRYDDAVRALKAARASVFVLDVTSADYHSLAVGLENVAADTGGLYLATYRLPGLATRTLARTISGYYVLTLDAAALGDLTGRVDIDLRSRNGTVLTRAVDMR